MEDIQLTNRIEEDERIVRYLQGKMTDEEEHSFFEELSNDADLRERAIIQARMIKGMKQIDAEIEGFHNNSVDKGTNKVYSLSTLSKRWLAIAASIVFVIFVGYKSYDYYETTSLGKEYANTLPMSTIIRGDTNKDVETELQELFDKVSNAEDLDNVTSRLATLWEQAKLDTYNDYTDYAPYIGWYLAIGYLENYEKAKAKEILKEMKQVYPEGTALGDKIREILNR